MAIEITQTLCEETQPLETLGRGDSFIDPVTRQLYILLEGSPVQGNMRTCRLNPVGQCFCAKRMEVLKVDLKIQWELSQ